VLNIEVSNMEESMCVNGLHREISTTETKCHATAKNKRCRTRRKRRKLMKRLKRPLYVSEVLSVKHLQLNTNCMTAVESLQPLIRLIIQEKTLPT
jgi:hypothetical protein